MADKEKDIALNIGVKTSGGDQVKAMATQLEQLAKEGGAAAPEFARLAAELTKLGEQQQAVASLNTLQAEADQTAAAFTEARQAANALDGALQSQVQKTEALRQEQTGAKAALEQTSKQLRDTKGDLDLLKASSDAATKGTEVYKSQVIELQTQLAKLRKEQADQRAEVQSTNSALRQSEGELRAAQQAYDGAASSAAKLGQAVSQQKTGLDQARIAMTQSGVAAADLAEAEQEVAQGIERNRQETQGLVDANERAASATAALADAERQLQAEMQFEAETAQRLVQIENEQAAASEHAAQAKRDEAAAAEQAAAAQQDAAQQAQQALQQAFGTLGLRSVQQIEEELARVRAALNTIRETAGVSGSGLSQAMAAGQRQINALERELRAANGELTLMDRITNGLNTSIGQFTAGALFANVIQGAAYAVTQLGHEALDANVKLQQLQLGLKSVYGSSAIAADQIEFLRNAAQRAGVSVNDISGSFVKFSASAKDAGIPMQTVNGLFSSLTKSAATLGLSGDKVADMLNALGQMASKGVVQMEELRGQLGDALPGALPKVAQGLGITTAEMEKMAREGGLLVSDVFPALQRVLEQSGGEVDTISARWARFKNVMSETAQDVGQSGIGQALGGAFTGVARVAEHLAFTVSLIGESFTVTGKQIGVAMADIVDQGVKFRGFSDNAKKAFQEVEDESTGRLTKLAARIEGIETTARNSFDGVGTAAKGSAQSIQLVGDKVTYVDQQARAAAGGMQANATAHDAAGAAAGKNATAQGAAGAATGAAGQQAAGATTSWTQLTVAYSKVNDALEQQAKVAKATLDAKKAEGQAAQEMARISGNEVQVRQAATVAATEQAKAQADYTTALSNELNVMRAQLAAEVALYNQSKTKEDAQRKAIEDLSKSIQVKSEELTKNREVTESLRNEVAARQVASEVLKDNSKRLYELRDAYKTATDAAESLRAKKDLSAEGSAKLAEADRKAAQAAALYADALADQQAKLEANSRAKQAQYNLDEQSIQLEMEQMRTVEEVARARGDEKTAIEASNRVRQLQIDLLRLQAQAQRAEAEAVLAALPAKRAQLELEGKLTEAMKKSLEAEELAAKAKLKQSEITEELADRMGRVAQATHDAAQAAGDSAGGYDQLSSSMDRASASADRLGRSVRSIGSTTYSAGEAPVIGADGKPIQGVVQKTVMGMDMDALATLRQKRDLGLLSTSDKATAEAAYMAETANAAAITGMNQAFVSPGVSQQASNRAADAKRILDSIRAMEAGAAGGSLAPATKATTTGSTTHTVNIQIGGASAQVGMASAADAATLTNMLKQLGTASQRAS